MNVLNNIKEPSLIEKALHPITISELESAKLSPRCIVPNLLYADVRTRIAAGGVGKTTLALHEAVRLALGKPVWDRLPPQAVRTCMVTREDQRSILVARLREVMNAQKLTDTERRKVLENVIIIDLSSESFRLSEISGDVVEPHHNNVDSLCSTLKQWCPDWVIFDPLVSFGVGESRVNDAEQGLIEAFRIIRNRLNCCVEGIHHSGKANAREKTLDQYSGRGGSSLSDGSRMVAVIQPIEAKDWLQETGTRLEVGESGLVMALPKLSYAAPQDPIFIRRYGFYFSIEHSSKATPTDVVQTNAQTVLDFISAEWLLGRRYSKAHMDAQQSKLELSRQQVREALSELEVSGQVVYREVKGKTGSHFEPVTLAKGNGETPSKSNEMEAA
jgi:RecA-family ATPase